MMPEECPADTDHWTASRGVPSTLRSVLLAAITIGAVGCSTATPEGPTPEQARVVQQLGSVDHRLGSDPSIALKLADRICAELKAGRSPAEIAAEVQRFNSGEGTISLEQAAKAVSSARESLCPAAP